MLHGHADSVWFYDEVIAAYKGALEEWYVANQGLRRYLLLPHENRQHRFAALAGWLEGSRHGRLVVAAVGAVAVRARR